MTTYIVNLKKDFDDYYDHELENYSEVSEQIIDRRYSSNMDKISQLSFLNKAGFITPIFGLADVAIVQYEAKHILSDIDEDKIAFIKIEQNGERQLISLGQARKLDHQAFLFEYIQQTISPSEFQQITYCHFGSLYSWSRNTNNLYTVTSNIQLAKSTMLNQQESNLPRAYLRFFSAPLFSVKFIISNSDKYAVGYSTTPNLSLLGVSTRFTAKEVAKSLYLSTVKSHPDDL